MLTRPQLLWFLLLQTALSVRLDYNYFRFNVHGSSRNSVGNGGNPWPFSFAGAFPLLALGLFRFCFALGGEKSWGGGRVGCF